MAYTTIDDPEAYFQVQLYTGNGSANHAITLGGDTDMQPDFVWIKNRDATDNHCLFDAVRGATKLLTSNLGDVVGSNEVTDTDTLDSFTSDGFQVDADVKVNTSSEDYVAWCWKANGTGSANTSGSINTTATSANTTSGFSIIDYVGNQTDGSTIGHGLGAVPHVFMVHVRNADESAWFVYHHKNTSAPETDYLQLHGTNATSDYNLAWNDTAPTSTLITLGRESHVSYNTKNMICYAWTEIQGFSKFGSYTGNGNVDGPFVFCGFRPAWFMIKNTSTTSNWTIFDNKRDGYNEITKSLDANVSNAEDTDVAYNDVDFCSNGIKIREDNGDLNGSGNNIIYMAFAEAPFVNSNGVPCNAR